MIAEGVSATNKLHVTAMRCIVDNCKAAVVLCASFQEASPQCILLQDHRSSFYIVGASLALELCALSNLEAEKV